MILLYVLVNVDYHIIVLVQCQPLIIFLYSKNLLHSFVGIIHVLNRQIYRPRSMRLRPDAQFIFTSLPSSKYPVFKKLIAKRIKWVVEKLEFCVECRIIGTRMFVFIRRFMNLIQILVSNQDCQKIKNKKKTTWVYSTKSFFQTIQW